MAKLWVIGIISLAAIADDLTRRRISNWIPVAALISGLVLQSAGRGWVGLGASLLGALAGGCVFLVFYILGGMGGGDIKLMAAFGSILGSRAILEAALWIAACGGFLAVLVILVHAVRRTPPALRPTSVPYAPAIAAGIWLSMIPKV